MLRHPIQVDLDLIFGIRSLGITREYGMEPGVLQLGERLAHILLVGKLSFGLAAGGQQGHCEEENKPVHVARLMLRIYRNSA
jgi:hypothetical protein